MRIPRWLAVASALLGAAACKPGLIGDPAAESAPNDHPRKPSDPVDPNMPPPPPPPDPCLNAPVDVPFVPLQRMNGTQLLNTERAIFAQPSLTLTLESGESTNITQLEAEKINDAAETLIATRGHDAYAPCDVHGAGSDACAQTFIQMFGEKTFRRPLAPDELTWLTGVFNDARNIPDVDPPISFEEAIDVVAQVILQSPQHLYISALGVADNTLPAGIHRTTTFERATRLAYTLTNSTPDDALIAAAKSGALDAIEGLRLEAGRLLDGPGGHTIVRHFGASYAGINPTVSLPALETLPKDPTRFPFDSPALRSAIRTETEALFERVLYGNGGGGGSFSELMTTTDAYVNGPLAELYGVSGGPEDENTVAWVSLDHAQRAGLFTRAGFLAEFANQLYQSPIRRGVHIYRDTLCRVVPPPPPNVNTTPPAPSNDGPEALSVRAQTEQRTSSTFCNSCHGQFNPIGFTFEQYDAMGRWQTMDTGTTPAGTAFSVPVDANVNIAVSDLAGMVSGGVGISEKLAESREARDCMVKQWFTQMMGRTPDQEDTCTVAQLNHTFADSSDLHALVVDVMASAPTLYVRTGN